MERPGASLSIGFEEEQSCTQSNVLTSRDLIREAHRQISKSRSLVERSRELRAKLKQTLRRNRRNTIHLELSSRAKRDSL